MYYMHNKNDIVAFGAIGGTLKRNVTLSRALQSYKPTRVQAYLTFFRSVSSFIKENRV